MNIRIAPHLPRLAAQQDILNRMAFVATLLVPIFLFYGRAIADGLISTVAILFLLHSYGSSEWEWTRRTWVRVAVAFWLLVLASSARSGPVHSMLEALVMVRLLLFCAALEAWVLVDARHRRWLGFMMAVLALWLVIECWQQYLTGRNIEGFPRWSDGSLTGPFFKPRAGSTFFKTLFPGLMPFLLLLIQHDDRRARIVGGSAFIFLVLTMVLIGQRMPNLLMLLGLVISALIVRRFRLPAIAALVIGAVVIAALPVISPPTYGKLVLEFARQMSHFAASPYGQIYTRAAVMVIAHPWLGVGYEGFRYFCSNPLYFHGLRAYGIPTAPHPGLGGCNIHPHNYYLQTATMAGVPGLILFVTLVALWFARIVRAVRPRRAPQQTGLFVAFCLLFWPIASTSSIFTIPTAGWVFLIVGWALAASAVPGEAEDILGPTAVRFWHNRDNMHGS